jgi:pyruvate,water dikinase
LTAEVALAALAVAAATRLEATLRRYLSAEEARIWTGKVTTRHDGTVAGWPLVELRRVLESADPGCLDAIAESADLDDARERILLEAEGNRTWDEISRILRRSGSMAIPAGPTWSEAPDRTWPPLRQLALLTRSGQLAPQPKRLDPTALDDLLDGLAANPDWKRARIAHGQIVDYRRSTLRRIAEEASDFLERRERTKAAVLSVGGVVRRIHMVLGRRLVDQGSLDAPEDIEFYGERELTAAVTGQGRVPTLSEVGRRRRWLATCEEAVATAGYSSDAIDSNESHDIADVLHGLGASSGRTTGIARAIRDSTGAGLERGEVLVARTTDASWVPLFMVAGAVVVEEGGLLSHAAVVARELGIPAVLDVPGIVERVERQALKLTVDGDRGTVLVSEAGPLVTTPTRAPTGGSVETSSANVGRSR